MIQNLADGILVGSVLSLGAIGLTLVMHMLRFANFSHAELLSIGAYAALVSGGFTAFTGAVAVRLGFDENRANTLLAEGGVLLGDVGRPILGREAKVRALEEITERLGIGEAEVMAVGDGANDLGMLKRAGAGVALHAKPSVAAECDLRVNFGDLTALLYLQGYARDAFVA